MGRNRHPPGSEDGSRLLERARVIYGGDRAPEPWTPPHLDRISSVVLRSTPRAMSRAAEGIRRVGVDFVMLGPWRTPPPIRAGPGGLAEELTFDPTAPGASLQERCTIMTRPGEHVHGAMLLAVVILYVNASGEVSFCANHHRKRLGVAAWDAAARNHDTLVDARATSAPGECLQTARGASAPRAPAVNGCAPGSTFEVSPAPSALPARAQASFVTAGGFAWPHRSVDDLRAVLCGLRRCLDSSHVTNLKAFWYARRWSSCRRKSSGRLREYVRDPQGVASVPPAGTSTTTSSTTPPTLPTTRSCSKQRQPVRVACRCWTASKTGASRIRF